MSSEYNFYDNLKTTVTDKEVISALEKLGVTRYEEKSDYIIFPTVCHNTDIEQASMKLFFYKNTKLFHCYTQCSETFDIFRLIERIYQTRNISYNYYRDVVLFVKGTIPLRKQKEFDRLNYDLSWDKFKLKVQPAPIALSNNVLQAFTEFYDNGWPEEGITIESMKKFNIKFSITQNKIVIPHYDINNNLIGIRGRALNEEDMEKGKYAPITIENITFKHPLSLNLYGLNINKDNIKKKQACVIFEGEKSVLLMDGYYSNSIAVATCGSLFHKNQLNLLLPLGISEIVLAFDKENTNISNREKYFNKLYQMCKKYSIYCQMSFIYDRENILEDKDSPIDKGKEKYEYLLSKRIKV